MIDEENYHQQLKGHTKWLNLKGSQFAYCILHETSSCTDQPKKNTLFFVFRRGTPLHEKVFFMEKNKNHLFCRGFCLRIFAVKLCASLLRNFAIFGGQTPQDFAEKLREISWRVGKELMFLRADSEDSDQMEKLSECPAWYESPFEGS